MILLALIYINEVVYMMSFYWGTIAFRMTSSIEIDRFCLSNIESDTVMGLILLYNAKISQFTPIIWTMAFFVGFMFL